MAPKLNADEIVPYFASLADVSTITAYRRGRRLAGMDGRELSGEPVYVDEARRYAREWRDAQYDHAHASYFGVKRIRNTAAYWYGVARALRAHN